MTLQEEFANIDIYVFDQILRSNIAPGMRVLDAGCGSGRNIIYLMREHYEVFGVDSDPNAIASLQNTASLIAPELPATNFQVTAIEAMPFPDAFADVVLCHSVLHFAHSEAHLDSMVHALWRVLRPGGMLFCRLGSTIGAGNGIVFEPLGGRRFRMAHGAEWFLVDEAKLMDLTRKMGGELIDPLKTTVVQGQRCLTTWVIRKSAR